MIPDQIPYREVLHQEEDGEYLEGCDYLMGIGHVRDETFHGWESAAAEKRYWAEQRERDAARERLGGFGFSLARA